MAFYLAVSKLITNKVQIYKDLLKNIYYENKKSDMGFPFDIRKECIDTECKMKWERNIKISSYKVD